MPEELKSCRVCKKDVAEYASSCPHCGANHPADLDYSPVEAKSPEPVAEVVKPEPPTAKAPVISIHDAAEKGYIEAVKQHIAAGTDVNAKDDVRGRTPLHSHPHRCQ
tara:strand:- start:67 stop:387 length:321 start_codon:yes stop_codon:yes gene_type:complete